MGANPSTRAAVLLLENQSTPTPQRQRESRSFSEPFWVCLSNIRPAVVGITLLLRLWLALWQAASNLLATFDIISTALRKCLPGRTTLGNPVLTSTKFHHCYKA